MTTSSTRIILALEDSSLSVDELESLTQTVQGQIIDIAEDVSRVSVTRDTSGLTEKGEQKQPGLLNMEINLDRIKALVTWLYQRITGKMTKAKLKFGEGSDALEFEFEGTSQKDLVVTLEEVTVFVAKIKQIQQANQQSEKV